MKFKLQRRYEEIIRDLKDALSNLEYEHYGEIKKMEEEKEVLQKLNQKLVKSAEERVLHI